MMDKMELIETKKIKNKKIIEWGKKYLIDIILIITIMAISIFLRSPTLEISHTEEESQKIYSNSYTDDEGNIYMQDMDSYYYANMIKKIIANQASASDINLLTIMATITYKIISIFENISINKIIVLIGPYISALSVIPAYLFVKKRTNRLGGFVAGYMAACNAPFLLNTCFGNFDTDVLLCFLPLVYICAFIEALQEQNIKKQIIWSLISTLGFAGIVSIWSTYSIYYYLTLGIFVVFCIIEIIRQKFKIKNIIKCSYIRGGIICFLMYTISCLLIKRSIDISTITYVINLIQNLAAFTNGNYPDPGKHVSELSNIPIIYFEGSWEALFDITKCGAINRIGGITICALVLFALIMLMVKFILYLKTKEEKYKNNYILLVVFLIWTVGTVISIKAGIRFLKMLIIPISLLSGLGIGIITKLLNKVQIKFLPFLIAIVFAIMPMLRVYSFAKLISPYINDAVCQTADWIKNNSKEDAVIVSWWDLGYFYNYQAERNTVAHGGTFDGRYFYWLGNIFVTDNPNLSKGISEMLAYKGTEASNIADELMGDSKKGSEMLKEILILEKEEAKNILISKYSIEEEKADKLIELTHHESDKELYIIVSQDMLDKISAISYYGNWDFNNNESETPKTETVTNQTEDEENLIEIISDQSESEEKNLEESIIDQIIRKEDMVDKKTMLYRLFNEENDIENVFEYKCKIEDVMGKYTSIIWRIK